MSRSTAVAFAVAVATLTTACPRNDAAPASPAIDQKTAINRQSSPMQSSGKRRLVFLGDSLTAGFGLSAADAFPARIEARLTKDGLPFDVVNAGVSGDTSAGGLRRLDWLFRGPPVDVLFVCLGANDGLRGLPVAALDANLRAIVKKAKERGAEVVLAGMRIPMNYGAQYRTAFEDTFPRIAKELGVAFIPFLLMGVAGNPALNLGDGIHPNARGYDAIADALYPELVPILRKVGAGSR